MRKTFAPSFLLLSVPLTMAQAPTPEWERTFNGANSTFDEIKYVRLDASENVYVTGRTYTGASTQTDVTTIKYDSTGNLLWQHTYNDANYNLADEPFDMEVAPNGDVIVVGLTEMPGGFPPNGAGFVLALDGATGNLLWSHVLIGPGTGGATRNIVRKVLIAPSGEVHVTGYYMDNGGAIKMLLVKYDASGNQQWMQTIDSSTDPGTRVNDGRDLALDPSGNIFVCGGTALLTTWYDLALWKYSPTGSFEWLRTKPGPVDNTGETDRSVIVDAAGNAYTYGTHSGDRHRIMKYNSSGAEQWTLDLDTVLVWYAASYTGADEHLCFDNSGNLVLALGVSGAFGQKIGVLKIDPSGSIIWFNVYGGTGLYTSEVYKVMVDATDHILFTGALSNAGSSMFDMGTFKLDPNGNVLWTIVHNGPSNGTDKGHSMALGAGGALYVGGTSAGYVNSNGDYYLAKYLGAGGTTSMNAATPGAMLSLQPNPTEGVVHIRFADADARTLGLRDALGRTILLPWTSRDATVELDLSRLTAGIYLLDVHSAARRETHRIIVR